MSEVYDATFAAVSRRIGNPDLSGALERACSEVLDVSYLKARLQESITAVEHDLRRPFVLLRPKMFMDGNQCCALYGENLQQGVAGFGDSPDAASWAFDKAWTSSASSSRGGA